MNNNKSHLSSSERIAGYLYCSAKLAMLGAKLRKNGREDESFTEEENKEWDDICDEIESWFYLLSKEERAAIQDVEKILAILTRGESLV